MFFRNSQCLACGTPLGYEPGRARVLPLRPAEPSPTGPAIKGERWQAWDDVQRSADRSPREPPRYQRCANLSTPAACNWLVADSDPGGAAGWCVACRLNRTIPDLNDAKHPDNGVLWGRFEVAKRRLVSALLVLGLPVASRLNEDTERGLMVDFLRAPDGGPPVRTGHDEGLITLDICEADDAHRESARDALHEPYRTLLGHWRHEIGHYYWWRLVDSQPAWLADFRQLFGDERADYARSLQAHYENGPPADWPLHFVSAYASSHPWEDWAECWAHYLHMRDGLDTALSFGVNAGQLQLADFTPFELDALFRPEHPEAQAFLDVVNDWARLTTMLNEMSRAMGLPDFYPFVLPHQAVAKLQLIHFLVQNWRQPEPDAAEAEAAAALSRSAS